MRGSKNYFEFTELVNKDDDEKAFKDSSRLDDHGFDMDDDDDDDRKNKTCFVTVEPVVLLFYMAYSMMSTMRTEYVTKRIYNEYDIHNGLRLNFDPWRDECDEPINASISNYTNTSMNMENAQADASYWLLIYNLVQIFPAMIVSPLIGSWSDRAGRKVAMLLPAFGYLIGISIWLVVFYYHLSKSYITIAYLIMGSFGDFPTLLAVCNAYMSDIATRQSRTYRMIILGIVIEFTTGVSQIVIGFWIFYSGFAAPFWFIFAAIVTVIAYIVIFLKESNTNIGERPANFFSASQFDAVFALFARADSRKRSELVSCLVVLGVHMMSLHSTFLLVLLVVLSPPLCWTSIIVGFYIASSFLFGSVGTLIGGKLFSGLTDDLTISQIGIWSSLIGLSFIAFGNSSLVLFLGAMLGSFRFLTSPSMRSRLSKLADEHEQGAVLACASCVESLGSLIGPSLYNLIYSLTLEYFRGIVFLVMAALYVPISVLVTYHRWYDLITTAPSIDEKRGSDVKTPE
ncbi:proton-coupled folate transporter-like [Lytechinus pictus]|uniref:proton-coupled folate transporter-like n=1 Tax=Lytechinus pictus TaxID=7653 RepID=UPI0030B9D7AB